MNEALNKDEDCRVKKKSSIRRKARISKASISGSSGFKAFIAQQRKNMKSDVNMNDNVSNNLTSSVEEAQSAGSPGRSYLSPERVFDGGFFSVKSPATLKISQFPRNTQSAGILMLRSSTLVDLESITSGGGADSVYLLKSIPMKSPC